MKNLFTIIYFGYGILIFAALINWVGKAVGFKSWYDFFGGISFGDLSAINVFYLVVAYPLLLGSCIYILDKYKDLIIK